MEKLTEVYRGSRKHILDLLDSGRLFTVLNELFADTDIQFGDNEYCQPKGRKAPEEWTLRNFCKKYYSGKFDYQTFDNWWVSDKYRNPQWDLLTTCTIKGKPGILLVEAKANDKELVTDGKPLDDKSSKQSEINHDKISDCIFEAAQWLNNHIGDIGISRDTHYQLSNRVASAWKLAQCGLSTVLLYLGFTGDEGIRDAGEPFADDNHWQRVMGAYMAGMLPLHLPDKLIEVEDRATIQMFIKSLPVIEISSKANNVREVKQSTPTSAGPELL
jgi:hypothetical protein